MSDLVINGALIVLVITLIGSTVKTVLFVTKMKEDLLAALTSQVDALVAKLAAQDLAHHARVAQMERDHHEELAALRREFGTVGEAIRQKVNQFEIWSRDEFVRKGSFEIVIARMEKSNETLGDKIEKRLDKMAERIEKITHQ